MNYNAYNAIDESLLLEYNRADLKAFAGADLANRFILLRPKLQAPENDLGYWIKKGDVKEFEQFVQDWESGARKSNTEKAKEEKINGAQLIKNEKGWKVYHVTSYDAAKRLGSGTTWCITGRYHGAESRGQHYFDSYIKDYDLDGYYFIFDTLHKDSTTGDYLKYCAGLTNGGRLVFLYNGMQDREISQRGIPDIEEDRQIELVPGANIEFAAPALVVKDGVLKVADPRALEYSDVQIPQGVTTISRAVFNKMHLGVVTLPDTVKTIEPLAFAGAGIREIVIPGSVSEIGAFAFKDAAITSLTIEPGDLKKIGKGVFMAAHITTLTIPNTVEEIDDTAFFDLRADSVHTQNQAVIDACNGEPGIRQINQ